MSAEAYKRLVMANTMENVRKDLLVETTQTFSEEARYNYNNYIKSIEQTSVGAHAAAIMPDRPESIQMSIEVPQEPSPNADWLLKKYSKNPLASFLDQNHEDVVAYLEKEGNVTPKEIAEFLQQLRALT